MEASMEKIELGLLMTVKLLHNLDYLPTDFHMKGK